jgi:hypothetical protein
VVTVTTAVCRSLDGASRSWVSGLEEKPRAHVRRHLVG